MGPRTFERSNPESHRASILSLIDKNNLSVSDANGSSSSRPLVEGERRQSWRQWAGEKIRQRKAARLRSDEPGMHKLVLFPGWALRRYERADTAGQEGARFSLEIFIFGFATIDSPPERTTRTQRAFLKLARAYAGLPKSQSLIDHANGRNVVACRPGSPSKFTKERPKTEKPPLLPGEITDDDMRMLDQQLEQLDETVDSDSNSSFSRDSDPRTGTFVENVKLMAPHKVAQLHANLHQRLRLFWSRTLPNRTVRLSIHTHPGDASAAAYEPIYVCDVETNTDGTFTANILVPWERLCDRMDAMYIAFGDPQMDAEIFVRAELSPAKDAPKNVVPRYAVQKTEQTISIPITHSCVRLISDIDDTIRHTGVNSGIRSIFQNIFVREHEEVALPEMSDWYASLWSRGVRFHYVSNGPFELLPNINELIDKANFPRGSISLRSFLGLTLFSGYFTRSFTHKYNSILGLLEAFEDSQFFLVGDSGEKDLEIYTQVALERPHQVLSIFIRYVNSEESGALADPTGEFVREHVPVGKRDPGTIATALSPLSSTIELPPEKTNFDETRGRSPEEFTNRRRLLLWNRTQSDSTLNFPGRKSLSLREWANRSANASRTSFSPSDNAPSPGSISNTGRTSPSAAERRRIKLQERIYRARLLLPKHIYLRVFQKPEECTEARRILDELCERS